VVYNLFAGTVYVGNRIGKMEPVYFGFKLS